MLWSEYLQFRIVSIPKSNQLSILRIVIKDLCKLLTHKMIWLPKNRPPETPWLLQSSAAAVVKSREVQCREGMQSIIYIVLAGVVEGSLKGIGTPWLSQYTDQLFQSFPLSAKTKIRIKFRGA